MRGKYITSHGYVMVKVPAGHHLAMTRGYAYEHRLVAEQKLGRRLKPEEEVHHINEDTTDNRPENLEVCSSLAEHKVRHRKDKTKKLPDQLNEVVRCACGCGGTLLKFHKSGRARKFLPYHNGITSYTKNPSPRLVAVLEYLKQNGPSSTAAILKDLGETQPYLSCCLLQLCRRNRVRRESSEERRGFTWSLSIDKKLQS